MTLSVQVLFATPRREIATLLSSLYDRCQTARVVAGFMTVEGFESIAAPLCAQPDKLQAIVVGAGTWRAYDAFDRLLALGVQQDRLRVHLGHSRPTTAGARHPFLRYHPMLHSKVFMFTLEHETSAALIGSHNLTGFALTGLNGEAGVLIEGLAGAQPFTDVRKHIDAAVAESVQYDPLDREAYAWWASQFMDGLAAKFNDAPREGKAEKTIVILAEHGAGVPKNGEVIYFELPAALGRVQSLQADIHVYLFDRLPSSPSLALAQLRQARASVWCRTVGLEDDRGGQELRAEWIIADNRHPVLSRAPKPFRPTPAADTQQVRVRAYNAVAGRFEYLFGIESLPSNRCLTGAKLFGSVR